MSNLCYLIPVHVLAPRTVHGVAAWSGTSWPNLLHIVFVSSEVLYLNPSTWADQEWSWAQRSKFLLRQMCKATCGRSPTEGVTVRSCKQTNQTHHARGSGSLLCTWSLRALYILDHTCHSWNPKPFLILSRSFLVSLEWCPISFAESTILCLSLPCFSMLLWGLNLYHKGCIRTLHGRNAAGYSEESVIPWSQKFCQEKMKQTRLAELQSNENSWKIYLII